MDRITEVYKKFKHLDKLLSDEEWLGKEHLPNQILYDLWIAIKETVGSQIQT